MAKPARKQVSGYVPEWMKVELASMLASNDRLLESALVQEGLEIAIPELRKRHCGVSRRTSPHGLPSHENPRRRKRT